MRSGRNSGDQSRPVITAPPEVSTRYPESPGRPNHPAPCSGSSGQHRSRLTAAATAAGSRPSATRPAHTAGSAPACGSTTSPVPVPSGLAIRKGAGVTRPIILLALAKQQSGPAHVLWTWSLTNRAARRPSSPERGARLVTTGPVRPGPAPASATTPAAAVAALYSDHAVSLIRLAYLMLGDRAAAEDAVQDAFFGLYRHWDRLADPGRALRLRRGRRC